MSCTNIEEIIFEENSLLISIGASVFKDCIKLKSITIPNSVTSIGDWAFSGCTSLESIVIPNSVTSIGKYVFDYCTNLTIYCEATSIPSGWHSLWNVEDRLVIWGYKNN